MRCGRIWRSSEWWRRRGCAMRELIAIVRADGDTRLPDVARQVLQVLACQIEHIEAAISALERQLLTWHMSNAVSQRLASIRALGRSSPQPLPRRLWTRMRSARAESSPPGWAWCR